MRRSWIIDRRALLMAVCCTSLLLAGCVLPVSPQQRVVKRFLQAVNDNDMNSLLMCIDPRQERLARATFRIVEKLTGVPIEDILDLVPGLTQIFPNANTGGISISDIRFLEQTRGGEEDANVTASIVVNIKSGASSRVVRQTVLFALHDFGDAGWRIRQVTGVSETAGAAGGAIVPAERQRSTATVTANPTSQIDDVAAAKQTMADMRAIATAWEARATDQNSFATAGQAFDMPAIAISAEDLAALLVPTYIRSLPAVDGWGNQYSFAVDESVGRAAQRYMIRSPGSDGTYEESYVPGTQTSRYDCDIVYSNGAFIQWPENLGPP